MNTRFNLNEVARIGFSYSERKKAVSIFNALARASGFEVIECERTKIKNTKINCTKKQFKDLLTSTYRVIRPETILT